MESEFNAKAQRGKAARVGLQTVKEGATNGHTPASNGPFVGFLFLFFAPSHLCAFALNPNPDIEIAAAQGL